jgi:hydrogenase maturation factor
MITRDQYDKAVAERDAAEKVINEFNKQRVSNFRERWAKFESGEQFFSAADLRYSATARCSKCHAGLAYPKDCDMWHQWSCSAVLKGEAKDTAGHEALPFQFYSVKSEDQPSAGKATTRPQ